MLFVERENVPREAIDLMISEFWLLFAAVRETTQNEQRNYHTLNTMQLQADCDTDSRIQLKLLS